MVDKVQTLERRLIARRCVACGYDGALLRGGLAERCARCGCDLRRRPARSYAEMEGLLGTPLVAERRPTRPHDEHLIHRWLAFLFCAALLLIVLGYLVASVVRV